MAGPRHGGARRRSGHGPLLGAEVRLRYEADEPIALDDQDADEARRLMEQNHLDRVLVGPDRDELVRGDVVHRRRAGVAAWCALSRTPGFASPARRAP